MENVLARLRRYESDLPVVFATYLSETVGLPMGTDRLEWQLDALKSRDELLESINQRFRNAVFDASWQLIDRFGQAVTDRSAGEDPG